MRIVHFACGRTLKYEDAPPPPPSPAKFQPPSWTVGKFHLKRHFAAEYGPRPLLEAAWDHCRWFIGERTICGQKTEHERSYCPHHAKRVYQRSSHEQTAVDAAVL
jgi:hypothetical protein